MTSAERQKLHSNVISVYRKATCENHNHEDDNAHLLSDVQALNFYELRAPYTYLRFSRLRMAIRLFCRAPFEIVALVSATRGEDGKFIATQSNTHIEHAHRPSQDVRDTAQDGIAGEMTVGVVQ